MNVGATQGATGGSDRLNQGHRRSEVLRLLGLVAGFRSAGCPRRPTSNIRIVLAEGHPPTAQCGRGTPSGGADDEALTEIARSVPLPSAPVRSPYMTIPEAADYLRCSRQRVDDLLSQGRLTRVKEGRRTLVSRAEIATYLSNGREARLTRPLPS